MAKTNNAKTNGHTVPALKPAASKKVALPSKAGVKEAAAKPAVKAAPTKTAGKAAPARTAAKPAAPKAAARPAAKAAARPAAKAAPGLKAAPKPPAKPAVKVATAKVPAKPAAKPAAKTAKPSAAPSAAPATDDAKDKLRKSKLVRDSFTMPEQEYAVLGQVKKACIKAGFEIKKSELLRIGVALISQLDMATLQRVLDSLPTLKTGRPRNE